MNYKIYIESLNNFPAQEHGVSALMGFRARQADIILFEDIEEVPVRKENIVVACIETTNKYFEKLGLTPKMALNIPHEIQKYADRNITRSNMGGLRHAVSIGAREFPFFIKGNGRAKHFVPGVVKTKDNFNLFFNDVSDLEPVLVSEVVDFVSEYRTYICKGEVLGIKHYLGDIWKFPNPQTILSAIGDYKPAPEGYSMDFGITEDGRTLLVECNDGWSLGNYGLEDNKYCKLLSARWLELMKTI
jgi:hypothetical protein